MSSSDSQRIRALRMLMALDGTVLAFLGVAFLCCPEQIEAAFHFKDVSPAVNFLVGLWGCALLSLGVGYFFAATNPVEHRLWVAIGALRGGLEAVFGWWCLAHGIVIWKQSGLTILLAAFMAVAYLALYPRRAKDDSWKLPH
jgi:hypothetical protein